MERLAIQQLMANIASIGKVWSPQPHQCHAQVYEGEQEAIIDPALRMLTRAAFSASVRASEMDIGTTGYTWLINAGNRREDAGDARCPQHRTCAKEGTPPVIARALQVIWLLGNTHAAMVACACSPHGPRSPVGETHRIHT